MGNVIEYMVVEHIPDKNTGSGYTPSILGKFRCDGSRYWVYVNHTLSEDASDVSLFDIGDKLKDYRKVLVDPILNTRAGWLAVEGWSEILTDEQLNLAKLVHSTPTDNHALRVGVFRLS